MELLLGEAFKIAVEVHGNQRDKAGVPYLAHICRVMEQMDTDEERVVAILHDVLEDCGTPVVGIYGARILAAYGINVIDAIFSLTRASTTDPTYMDYIRRLSENPLAVKVKLADLRDNMRQDRLEKLPDGLRLYAKYREAYDFLIAKGR